MPVEIERKFLVRGAWPRDGARSRHLRQGYLSDSGLASVRVRLAGERAFLTVKDGAEGAVRREYEYEIPPEDATEMLDRLCRPPLIEKTRYEVEHAGLLWEVDVFEGANHGLILAEVELTTPDEPVDIPSWAAIEVTSDRRYRNAYLSRHPYPTWQD